MTRAFYGDDWDCVRLLSLLTEPDHEPVILGGLKERTVAMVASARPKLM